jgi:hypothetical protein
MFLDKWCRRLNRQNQQNQELLKLKNSLPSPKKNALQLSNDIINFISDKRKIPPEMPSFLGVSGVERIEQSKQVEKAYPIWLEESQRQYFSLFSLRLHAVAEDFKNAKINDGVDQNCIGPAESIFTMQDCAIDVGSLADKLPSY